MPLSMKHLPFFFLVSLSFSLRIQAKEEQTTNVDEKAPFKTPKPFEEFKPPRALRPVHGPLRPPKLTFEEKKPPIALQPVKGPLRPPTSTFEEEKPPYALRPVHGPLRPPMSTFEEEKPPIVLQPVEGPLRPPKESHVSHVEDAETFEESKYPRPKWVVKPPKTKEELNQQASEHANRQLSYRSPAETFEEMKPPHLEHPVKPPRG